MSTTDARFSVNLDIYDGHLVDVVEITTVKATKHVAEDAEDDHDDEGTIKMSPSSTVSQIIDEEIENAQDVVEE